MAYELTGNLYKIFDTEKKTDTFQAREFVVEVQDGNYPQYIKFQLVQDRCSLIDTYNEGDQVVVSFDIRGREWQAPSGEVKYFNSLNAWRINQPEAAPAPPDQPGTPMPDADSEPPGMDDDLPF